MNYNVNIMAERKGVVQFANLYLIETINVQTVPHQNVKEENVA